MQKMDNMDYKKEYERVFIRVSEIYDDVLGGEGVTICLEELIEEMNEAKKGNKAKLRELMEQNYTDRQTDRQKLEELLKGARK